MKNLNDLLKLVEEVASLREQESMIKTEKEAKELELANMLSGMDNTVEIGNFKVIQRPSLSYKLTDAGMKVMDTISFEDKLWKKTVDAKGCQGDSRFTPDMIVVTEGKVALTIKKAE